MAIDIDMDAEQVEELIERLDSTEIDLSSLCKSERVIGIAHAYGASPETIERLCTLDDAPSAFSVALASMGSSIQDAAKSFAGVGKAVGKLQLKMDKENEVVYYEPCKRKRWILLR